jgi:hypothetical protein
MTAIACGADGRRRSARDAPGATVHIFEIQTTTPKGHGPSSREVWRLTRAPNEVRLSVRITYDDGDIHSHEYRGVPRLGNAGVPRDMEEVGAEGRIRLRCDRREHRVYPRGATFRLRCDAPGNKLEGWTSWAERMPVIACEHEWEGSTTHFLSSLVFGDAPIERLVTQCCAYDLCDAYGGLRLLDN